MAWHRRAAPSRSSGAVIAAACALALLAAACGSDDGGRGAAPAPSPATTTAAPLPPNSGAAADTALVMASTTIWADIGRSVACDGQAEVKSILPPLGDPHDFEPSLADRARLGEADLVVTNGLDLEEGLEDTLESVEADGTPVFRAGDHMTTLDFDAETFGGHHDPDTESGKEYGDEGSDSGEDLGGGSEDPHVWLDPVRVAQAVESLGPALVAAGLDADRVAACSEAYLAELAQVHRHIVDTLAAVAPDRRKLVTNHDSLGYFADRYGFEVIGTVIPAVTTLAEPSPAGLEELAGLIEHEGVPAIFAEELHGAGEAEALANRLGNVAVARLYTGALGSAGSGAESYVDMMRHNAGVIADALGS